MRGFVSGVISDAQARGLSREAVGGAIFTVLTAVAIVPASLTCAAWEFEAGLMSFVAAVALLSWIRNRHPQRETPEGLDAASRWLGVRAKLAENPVFAEHSPLQVELWDRLLAYGAALGVPPAPAVRSRWASSRIRRPGRPTDEAGGACVSAIPATGRRGGARIR